MRTAIFLIRTDSVTDKQEGEVYFPEQKGIINCNVWQSPKLHDHRVVLATGEKAIQEVYDSYDIYFINQTP